MSQLERLSRPFPAKYVKAPPQGKYGSYVPHDVYNQALLAIVGSFDYRIVWVIRNEESKRIEGCLGELTVEIDNRVVTVKEVGDCENPNNWKTDGARLKDAASDAFKRCCMRLGLGLHLWSGQDYFLHEELTRRPGSQGGPDDPKTRPSTAGQSDPDGEKGPRVESSPAAAPSQPLASEEQRAEIERRARALHTSGIDILAARKEKGLPPSSLAKPGDVSAWLALLTELEGK